MVLLQWDASPGPLRRQEVCKGFGGGGEPLVRNNQGEEEQETGETQIQVQLDTCES